MRSVVLAVLAALVLAAPASAARTWGAYTPLDAGLGGTTTDATWSWTGPALTWAAPDGTVWGTAGTAMGPTVLGTGQEAAVDAPQASSDVLFTWTSGSGDAREGHARVLAPSRGGLADTLSLGSGLTGPLLTDVSAWGGMALAATVGGRVTVRTRKWLQDDWIGPVDLGAGRAVAVGTHVSNEVVVAYERAGELRVARVTQGIVESDVPVPGAQLGATAVREIALDDRGDALLVVLQPRPAGAPAGAGDQGRPLYAVRSSRAGAWTPVPEVSGWALDAAVDNGSAGDAVVVWSEQPTHAPGPLRLVRGDAGSGAFAAPVTLDDSPTSAPAVDVALDAGTLVTYQAASGARTVRRDGRGPFEAPLSVTCPGDASPVIGAGISSADGGYVIRGRDDAGGPIRVLATEEADTARDVRCGPRETPPAADGGRGGSTEAASSPPVIVPGGRPTMAAVAGQRLRRVLRSGLRLGVVVPQAGRPQVALVVSKRQARRLRLGRRATTIGRRTVSLSAGPNAVVVPVARRLRRALAKARRLTVQVRMTTPAGGLVLASTVTLRR